MDIDFNGLIENKQQHKIFITDRKYPSTSNMTMDSKHLNNIINRHLNWYAYIILQGSKKNILNNVLKLEI
jgi:hypothetical protein